MADRDDRPTERMRHREKRTIKPLSLLFTAGVLVVGTRMAISFVAVEVVGGGRIRPVSFVRALSANSGRRIAVVGGGASGIFAAVAAAESSTKPTVTVLEASSKTLVKVKISGGGRCNVLHDTSKPVHELLQGYPRGKKELNGLLQKRFGPVQAQEWFESRGVQLKTEDDGRMFPTTDTSQTIIDVLLKSAEKSHVTIRTRCKVDAINVDNEDGSFCLSIREKEGREEKRCEEWYDAVILATGSVPVGYRLAESLGHKLVPTVPSLFTLNAKLAVKEGGLLYGLSGVSVPRARVSFRLPAGDKSSEDGDPKTKTRRKKPKFLEQQGPLLITHHGLSGPATLRLSAFGARDFAACNYRGHLIVHWAPELGTTDHVANLLWKVTETNPKKTVATICPLLISSSSLPSSESGTTAIPRRLWAALVLAAGFKPDQVWGQASKKLVRKLAIQICECPIEMTGKGTFKDEFVTAGGVSLKEINMTTMESKKCPGLFFCGELIDVDGVTGGFNFMNAWGTGYVAGKSAAAAAAMHSISSARSIPVDDKAASA